MTLGRLLSISALSLILGAVSSPSPAQTFESPFLIDTVAGSDPVRDGGPATEALLDTPFGIALDAQGNLYIADDYNGLIRKVTPGGVIGTVAGSKQGFELGDNVPATTLWLIEPIAVATSADGVLYVADSNHSQVRRVTSDGIAHIVAGTGTYGFSGDGGPGAQAQLAVPRGVFEHDGSVYVADTFNQRIRKVAPDGTITTVAGNGQNGFSGDGAAATEAQLNYPEGVAVNDAGEIFIADTNNNRIRKVGTDGNISTVAGTGASGTAGEGGPATEAAVSLPHSIAIAGDGRLYIADTARVLAIGDDGNISRVAGGGAATDNPIVEGSPATEAFLNPWGVAVDQAGNVYLSDYLKHRIRKVTPAGALTTAAGMSHYRGDGAAATAATLFAPSGVEPDGQGGFYVADTLNNAVRHVTASGVISTVAGDGVAGFSGDGGPAAEARLYAPQAVCLDTQGHLYIADSYNRRIRKVDSTGMINTIAGTGETAPLGDGGPAADAALSFPADVKVDAAGNVYVVDGSANRVRIIDPSGTINTLAGTGESGFAGDGGLATAAQISYPSEVVLDEAAGNIYIADQNSSRLRVVGRDGVIQTQFKIIGTMAGIARDTDGSFYVANSNNNLIEHFTPGGDATIVASNSRGFSGDGGPAQTAALSDPEDVAVDASGNVFVADTANHRIRLLSAVPAIPADALKNAASFSGATVAPNSIVSLFGSHLARRTEVATATPLPVSLGGATVTLTDSANMTRPVPVFFVSRGQINCFIPAETATGTATLSVTDDQGHSASIDIEVAALAPGLFSADASGTGVAAASVLRVAADGSRTDSLTFEYDTAAGKFQAVPIDLGPDGDGIYLTLYGTGIGDNHTVTASVGGEDVPVLFAGAQGAFVGLDQANIGPLPRSLAGKGNVAIMLSVNGETTNEVTINIQ